jgi:hypothetical protein
MRRFLENKFVMHPPLWVVGGKKKKYFNKGVCVPPQNLEIFQKKEYGL